MPFVWPAQDFKKWLHQHIVLEISKVPFFCGTLSPAFTILLLHMPTNSLEICQIYCKTFSSFYYFQIKTSESNNQVLSECGNTPVLFAKFQFSHFRKKNSTFEYAFFYNAFPKVYLKIMTFYNFYKLYE